MRKIGFCASVLAGIILPALRMSAYPQTPNIEVKKIKEHYFRITTKIPYPTNQFAFVSKDGILLVDSGFKDTAAEFKSVLRALAVGNPQVKILINTHDHMDHAEGNLVLAGEPVIIGTELLRTAMHTGHNVFFNYPENALPNVTFKDSTDIDFGGETIRITALPKSHSPTDVMVHFRKAGIVCLGDVSYGMNFPSRDTYFGDVLLYPQAIDKALTLIPTNAIIISGHGRETTVEELKKFRDMISDTAKIVQQEMAKGKSVEALQKEDLLKAWSSFDGGPAGDRGSWIARLAEAGSRKMLEPPSDELHKRLIEGPADAAIKWYIELKKTARMNIAMKRLNWISRENGWIRRVERRKPSNCWNTAWRISRIREPPM